jgi:alpha-tubulin suppressor-like RCC1 family protein
MLYRTLTLLVLCLFAVLCSDCPAYVTVSGYITTNTTWTSDNTYYVSGIVFVCPGVELTIAPGTVVKFGDDASLSSGSGRIIACGTSDAYIIFTSKHDNTVGEIISGSSGNPAVSDWMGFDIHDASRVEFCKISYAYIGINWGGSPSLVSDNVISKCDYAMQGSYVYAPSGGIFIANNLVYDCLMGLSVLMDYCQNYIEIQFINNTFDGCAVQFHNDSVPDVIYLIMDSNLFTSSYVTVDSKYYAYISNNGFYDTAPLGQNSVVLTGSPYAEDYFLNSEAGAALVNAGNDWLCLDRFTTQPTGREDYYPNDIGYHHPAFAGPRLFAGGLCYSLFVDSNGSVWSCGSSPGLGTGCSGTYPNEHWIVEPDPNRINLEGIVAIDAGEYHSFAIDTEGHVWAWGWNASGEIGAGGPCFWDELGSYYVYWSPVQVKAEGTGFLSNIAKVSASRLDGAYNYAMALDSNGNVWAWGANYYIICDETTLYGQLGIGTTEYLRTIAVKVVGGEMGTTYLEDITDIEAGASHSIAIDEDGFVWTWGYNSQGQLGNGLEGDFMYETAPVKVLCGDMNTSSGYLSNIVDVAIAGGWEVTGYYGGTSYALDSNGHVWAWGYGGEGQLGDGQKNTSLDPHHTALPTQVEGLENIVAISAGDGHILALDGNGYVWAWGYNFFGQLGNRDDEDCTTPVKVQKGEVFGGGDLSDIVAIDAGSNHSMVIDDYGNIWVWGSNSGYELGLGYDTMNPHDAQMLIWP